MSRKPATDRLARSILDRALDRELDGQHDRIASIALSLLLHSDTQEVGKGLIRSFLSHPGRTKRNNQLDIPHPVETLALVAELQLPIRLSNVLWEAVLPQRRVAVMVKILSYAVMNNHPDWVSTSIAGVESQRDDPYFDRQALGHDAIGVIEELRGLHGNYIPEQELANPCWKMVLPWLLRQAIAVDHPNLEYHCEWLSGFLNRQSEPLPIEAALRFSSVDPELYPTLAAAAAQVRREALWKMAPKRSSLKDQAGSKL